MTTEIPALEYAKKKRAEGDDDDQSAILTLSTGVRVRVINMNPATLADVLSMLSPPKVPMWTNPDKGREEPNEADPSYQQARIDYQNEQAIATMDAVALLGVELVDGLPESSEWLKRLLLLQKLGRVNLSRFDLEDPLDLQYLYCRYIAIGVVDWGIIFRKIGVVTEAGVQNAAGFLPGG